MRRAGASGRGAWHAWGPANGACSSSFGLSGPARTERRGGHGEGVAGIAGVCVCGGGTRSFAPDERQ